MNRFRAESKERVHPASGDSENEIVTPGHDFFDLYIYIDTNSNNNLMGPGGDCGNRGKEGEKELN